MLCPRCHKKLNFILIGFFAEDRTFTSIYFSSCCDFLAYRHVVYHEDGTVSEVVHTNMGDIVMAVILDFITYIECREMGLTSWFDPKPLMEKIGNAVGRQLGSMFRGSHRSQEVAVD